MAAPEDATPREYQLLGWAATLLTNAPEDLPPGTHEAGLQNWLDAYHALTTAPAAQHPAPEAWAGSGFAALGTTADLDGEAPDEVRELAELRAVLTRLADDDIPVLDEGLGGGASEELHVRASLARQALGLALCGCTDCCVSLGIAPEDRP